MLIDVEAWQVGGWRHWLPAQRAHLRGAAMHRFVFTVGNWRDTLQVVRFSAFREDFSSFASARSQQHAVR
ncbi:hypothetical protein XvhCFBP2543_01230 [Xanthomonas vasicola]|nr:hypothetical protein NX04_20475 [Xanthomonas vasicola]KGR39133.1 hypothetical protein NX05_19730 [Xanthomonas vasicola]KGR59261.1 hypothetical protein NX79_15740 [Xanthomonas vasicola]PPV04526.1 hypothetical protein XvhCFBP2543_01230 [Xanthomonas vasicola]